MDADRNLLFAVLCLQADLFDTNRFAEACVAWTADKGTPLADLVTKRGWITPEERAHVEFLLERKLRKHGGDARASLAACADGGTRRVLAALGDPEVNRSLADFPADHGGLLPSTVTYPAATRDRYTLTRLHARGGLGQVWLAHDQEMGRDVALKELKPERANDAALWTRFLDEARITGQLEHPGIVPVYELGQRADSQEPFYTMRFVQGPTFREAIAAYHAGRARGEAGALELRALLGAFVTVCNAVAYAHSRGVLHRDLKPQNVVLGDYGEVLVLDWGLAKLVGRPESDRTAPPPIRPAVGSHEETVQGQVLGTPAYMAPEQAAGRQEAIDTRTDVYGLGAILYEILTGKPPFAGADQHQVLRWVCERPPERPRQVTRGVPAALEAVCLKALAKPRADRYPGAGELADEVRRWLADEPVRACREPLPQRLGRWSRRHRTAVTGAAALLVTALVALAAGLVAVNAERERTRQALSSEQEARAEEARRRGQARRALDALFANVIEDWIAQQPKMTDEQQRFLQQALTSYEEFARDTGQDPTSREGVAEAYQRVGSIRQRLGDLPGAEEALGLSTEQYARLARDFPEELRYRREVAENDNSLSAVLKRAGRANDAQEALSRAITAWEQLAAGPPAAAEDRSSVAIGRGNLGVLLKNSGHWKEAEEAYRQALAVQEQLEEEYPTVAKFRRARASVLINLGQLLMLDRRPKEAEDAFRQALASYRKLTSDHPDKPEYRLYLGRAHSGVGWSLAEAGRPEKAKEAYLEALKVQNLLAGDYPAVPAYRQDVAQTYDNLAELSVRNGDHKTAIAFYQLALFQRQRLATDFRTEPEYRQALASDQMALGNCHRNTGSVREAETAYKEARALQEKLVEEFPANADYHDDLGTTLHNHAGLLNDRKDYATAHNLLEEAARHHREALKANPRNPHYQSVWLANRFLLAAVLVHQGEHGRAAAATEEYAQASARNPDNLYRAAGILAERCIPLARKDPALTEAQRQQCATAYGDRAMAWLNQAVACGYKDVERLKKDRSLDPLRDRGDFARLLVELAPTRPAGK
jgi:serine/threonine-protein kinase